MIGGLEKKGLAGQTSQGDDVFIIEGLPTIDTRDITCPHCRKLLTILEHHHHKTEVTIMKVTKVVCHEDFGEKDRHA